MNPFAKTLNWIVRAYLRSVPITEGKKQLLRLTRACILPEDSIVTFDTRHGFRLIGNLCNPEHQRMYFYGDHDERYEVNNLKHLLRPGDTCWDVGANIGFYTCLFASLVGRTGRVVAFEPVAATYEFLRGNVELNHFGNVTLLRKAVGARRTTQMIYYSEADRAEGTASLRAVDSTGDGEQVEIDTLDNLSTDLPAADFIKIDVEGYQMEVLEGGRRYLSAHDPMIMAELKDPNRDTMRMAQDRIRALGYTLYEFEKYSLRRCNDILATGKRNFLMVKRDSPYFARVEPLLK